MNSSSLASIGYAPMNATLEVEFKHGALYRHIDVPAEMFAAFLAAESKGTFFNQVVKNGYPHQRVNG